MAWFYGRFFILAGIRTQEAGALFRVFRDNRIARSADAHIRELADLRDGNADVGIRAPIGWFMVEFWCEVFGFFHYAHRSPRT